MEKLRPSLDLIKGGSEKVMEKTQSNVRSLLNRHKDLVSPEVVEKIVDRETTTAVNKYLERRSVGLRNNGYSEAPGMTLFLDRKGMELLSEIVKRRNFNVEVNLLEGSGPEMFSAQFPTGTYGMPDEGALFAAETAGEEKRAQRFFYLPYKSVIRVEGKHGELWQNPEYDWDGTKKV